MFENEQRPTICFICLGNKSLDLGKRTHRFHSPGTLTTHFKRHIVKFNHDTGDDCNICQVHLGDMESLQRHAWDEHGTIS